MKEFIIKVPEEKVQFVMELMDQLGLEISASSEIPDFHKEIVRERIKNSNPDKLRNWEEVKDQFRFS